MLEAREMEGYWWRLREMLRRMLAGELELATLFSTNIECSIGTPGAREDTEHALAGRSHRAGPECEIVLRGNPDVSFLTLASIETMYKSEKYCIAGLGLRLMEMGIDVGLVARIITSMAADGRALATVSPSTWTRPFLGHLS